jgi:hypothetical protein
MPPNAGRRLWMTPPVRRVHIMRFPTVLSEERIHGNSRFAYRVSSALRACCSWRLMGQETAHLMQ